MGKDSPSPPPPPDPVATASAQTQMNQDTAYWNAVLNNVNQVTPYGTLTYTQSGGGTTYDDQAYQSAMNAYNAQVQSLTAQLGAAGNNQALIRQINSQLNSLEPPSYTDFVLSDAPPQFTSTVTLSPEQQAIYDAQTASDLALAQLGYDQLGRITDSVSSPYSYESLSPIMTEEDMNAARLATEEAIYSRLDPQFAKDEEALQTRLINQGIMPGSEAYMNEMDTFNQMKTDARYQATLAGAQEADMLFDNSMALRNQEIQEYNAQRNAPLNEYIAMTSGVQVQNPNFMSTGYTGAAPVDYASLVNQNYQNQMNAYNQQMASQNNMTSGLFGLAGQAAGGFLGSEAGSAMIAGMISDARLKENIVKIGETPAGINVYEYNFIGSDKTETGVLAQEVEEVIPDAVITDFDGYKRVNYSMVR